MLQHLYLLTFEKKVLLGLVVLYLNFFLVAVPSCIELILSSRRVGGVCHGSEVVGCNLVALIPVWRYFHGLAPSTVLLCEGKCRSRTRCRC